MDRLEKREKLAEKKRNEELLNKERGKAAQQQEALLMMMKMQLKEQQEKAERELEEALLERSVPSPVESNSAERDYLVSQITDLEGKLDDMDSVLEDMKVENKQLSRLHPYYLPISGQWYWHLYSNLLVSVNDLQSWGQYNRPF